MSHSNLPKTVLSSPSQSESQASTLNSATPTKSSVFSRYKFEETVEKSRVQLSEQDAHQKRLRHLRKQLDFIQETSWKYQPVDNFIGQ